jgi:hypothetical protein
MTKSSCKIFLNRFLRRAAWLPAVFFVNQAAGAGAEPFGSFHDFSAGAITVAANPAYSSWPLTVECRVKIDRQDQFNIIIAHETKKSPRHWEIYTTPKTGLFQAYLPGFNPATFSSGVCIADGQWHSVAMVIEETRVRLYVDGELKKEQPVSAPSAPALGQELKLGALVEGGMGCAGQIDEVRISKCVRSISGIPAAPFIADDDTVELRQFEDQKNSNAPDTVGAAGRGTDGEFLTGGFLRPDTV